MSAMFGTAYGLAVQVKYDGEGCTDDRCRSTCEMRTADMPEYEAWADLGVMRWAPGLPVLRFTSSLEGAAQ